MLVPKSIQALLQAVALAKSNPDATFSVPGGFPMSSEELILYWQKGVHRRASRGLVYPADADDRLSDLRWDAMQINHYQERRIRHSGCRNLLRDKRLKRKYPHIDNQPMDC